MSVSVVFAAVSKRSSRDAAVFLRRAQRRPLTLGSGHGALKRGYSGGVEGR